MSDFNRGLYSSGTQMQSIIKTQKDAERYDKKFYEESNRVGFHSIEEGKNTFRVAPAHDPKDSPYIPVRFSNLEVEVDEYDNDGNKTGNRVWKRRKCFIATQHGPWDERGNALVKDDPVEFYIEHLTELAKTKYTSEADRQKYLQPIHGFWDNGKFQWGIRPESKTICYAWDASNELKQLELNKKWYQDMEAMSFQASSEGALAVDIFSHIDTGIPLNIEKLIKRESGKRNKTEYKISKEEPNMMQRESWDDFFSRTRVDDIQIKELLNKKSLKEIYHQNYTRNDFIRSVKGLRRFDEKWGFQVFMDQNFLDKLHKIEEAVKKYIPEEEQIPEQKATEGESVGKEQEAPQAVIKSKDVKVPSEHEQEMEKLTVPKMRKFVKDYIKDNYDEGIKMPSLNKSELTKWYHLAMNGDDLPFEEDDKESSDLPWDDDDDLARQLDKLKSGK